MPPMFDFSKLIITNEDIASVEEHFGFKFNDGQKNVIRYWGDTDIQACPGSGKTTTLAAKLIILAKKFPKALKQGVCVITHTNVAVQEIKNKLGSYSNFYLNYPNHLGTIQSVVDKFFTIPAYKKEYKSSPSIDNDSYFDLIERVKSQDVEKARYYLSTNKGIGYLGVLSFNKFNFDISANINIKEPIVAKHTKTYITLLKLKDILLQAGYIKYDEAYSIAFKYLRENPQLIELFNKRFPLVFIDEMQDMETHQSELISSLCDDSSVIVQKIGDINQSIYNYSSLENQIEWKPKVNLELQLRETARISDNIVNAVKNICLEPQEIIGWRNPNPIKPAVIVYNDSSILLVKDKFGEILIQNNIHQKNICKAVGARFSDSRLNINSYWKEFNRGFNKKDFSNILSFLEYGKYMAKQSKNVRMLRNLFLIILCKCLRLSKIKNPKSKIPFTPITLVQYLNALDDASPLILLNNNIAKWILALSESVIIKAEIEKYVLVLIALFEAKPNEDLNMFFTNPEIESIDENLENNIYKFIKDENQVEIHFDTIHGVKGETHQATLYLETFNRIFDIGDKILDFIISDEKQKLRNRKNDTFKKRLPLAYVAMTRAKEFICLAVHNDRFTEDHKAFFESSSDWDIIYI